MKRQLISASAISCALLLTGCAPKSNFPTIDNRLAKAEAHKQRVVAMEMQFRHFKRLWNVSSRILAANASLCGNKIKRSLGILAQTLEHYDQEWREIARTTLSVGKQLTVTHVVEGSPAHAAGLLVGDKIISMNNEALGSGKQASEKLRDMLRSHQSGDTKFAIKRGGEQHTLVGKFATSCDYPVQLVQKDTVNAWADGSKIYISTGMLRFTENDEELALIIGHELAHNTRGHIEAKRGNWLIGAIVGAAVTAYSGVDVTNLGAQAGAGAFSQDFESEADYVGLYHAGRAGYDLKNAVSFWRRLGAAHPAAIHLTGSTHPSTAKRFLAIEKALAEFEHKRKSILPLIPDERGKQ